MKIIRRLKEIINKFIFCYTATRNFSSCLSLIWFTKLYRFRKKSNKYKKYQNKFFSISLSAFHNKKIYLRIYAGDIDIFYEIFYRKIYELPESKNNLLIIDVGANTGLATLYFLNKMPNAIIYCIEPDPDNFLILQKNLQTEIENGKVIIELAALSDKDGFVNLTNNRFKYNTSITNELTANEAPTIAYSVASFLKKYNINKVDLFKIDIEGAEENIFENYVSWFGTVQEILIEFHSEKIQEMCFEKFESQKMNFLPNINRKNSAVFRFVRNT